MRIKKKLQQYSVLIVGLLIGGGFAFGGIASYSSMVSSGGSSTDNGQQEAPELPSSNVVDGGFDLSLQEQVALAYRNDVVFVTVLKNGTSVEFDRQALVSDFSGRVYITSENPETSALTGRLQDASYPTAVAVSAVVSNRRLQPRLIQVEPDRESITAATCEALRSWDSVAAICTAR